MKRTWIVLFVGAALALSALPCVPEESSCYLGNKLEFVLQHVDRDYVEHNKKNLGTRYKKAFRDLADHLTKQYPTLQADLALWLHENYAAELEPMNNQELEKRRFTFDTLLALDQQTEGFRGRLLTHVRTTYPRLLGEIACFLRDKHPAALREVLRMTLRMTSHVKPCSSLVLPPATEADAKPLKTDAEVPPEAP